MVRMAGILVLDKQCSNFGPIISQMNLVKIFDLELIFLI